MDITAAAWWTGFLDERDLIFANRAMRTYPGENICNSIHFLLEPTSIRKQSTNTHRINNYYFQLKLFCWEYHGRVHGIIFDSACVSDSVRWRRTMLKHGMGTRVASQGGRAKSDAARTGKARRRETSCDCS